MKLFKLKKTLIASLLMLGISSIASANSEIWVDDQLGNIYTVDANTGTTKLVGDSKQPLTDIAFAPTGLLYGVSFSSLYSINTSTGLASLIGNLGVSDVNGLTFDSKGNLYASSTGNSTGAIYSINISNGQATDVFDAHVQSSGDLAYHNGELYLTGQSKSAPNSALSDLWMIDVANKVAVDKGSTGVDNMYGLANGTDNVLYGVAGKNVYKLDTSNGNATQISTDTISSVAYGATAPIPEPEQWVLLLTGMALLNMITRRKQSA